jgi:RNA polymerase sigma-70 factor (ECF subfamily)
LIDPHGSEFEPSSTDSIERLDPAHVAALFVKHADELRNFLIGVLRNRDQADDVLQVAFAKLVEVGHTAREESVKGWLFRVAYNEAIVVRRRQAIHRRATDTLAETENRSPLPPDVPLLRRETVEQVRAAIEQLPAEQRQVVRMRMYDQKKFIQISAELKLPLGTVLTRMQLALKKLRKALDHPSSLR